MDLILAFLEGEDEYLGREYLKNKIRLWKRENLEKYTYIRF